MRSPTDASGIGKITALRHRAIHESPLRCGLDSGKRCRGGAATRPPKNRVFRISRREITGSFRLTAMDFAQAKSTGGSMPRPPKNRVFRISRREITGSFRLTAMDLAQAKSTGGSMPRPYGFYMQGGGRERRPYAENAAGMRGNSGKRVGATLAVAHRCQRHRENRRVAAAGDSGIAPTVF